jgi:hypothetical protein
MKLTAEWAMRNRKRLSADAQRWQGWLLVERNQVRCSPRKSGSPRKFQKRRGAQ